MVHDREFFFFFFTQMLLNCIQHKLIYAFAFFLCVRLSFLPLFSLPPQSYEERAFPRANIEKGRTKKEEESWQRLGTVADGRREKAGKGRTAFSVTFPVSFPVPARGFAPLQVLQGSRAVKGICGEQSALFPPEQHSH